MTDRYRNYVFYVGTAAVFAFCKQSQPIVHCTMFMVIHVPAACVRPQVLYHGHRAILALAPQIHGPPAQGYSGGLAGFLDTGRTEDLDHGLVNTPCLHRLFRTGFIHCSSLKPDVDLVIRPQTMCASSFRCVFIPSIGSEVIRIAVHMPIDQITFCRILRPEEFPRFCRLEISVPPKCNTIGTPCEFMWRLVAAPSSVENLTVHFAADTFRAPTYGVRELAVFLENPGTALRHISLRGTPTGMQDVAAAVVAMSTQLETLRLVELDPFLSNALDKRRSTNQVVIACRRLQFSSVRLIPTQSTSDLLVAWDRLFADPRLRCIMVICFQSNCPWPSTKLIDPPQPPVLVPGRRVIIQLRDRTEKWWDNWNAIEWLERLAGTATEVEFYIDFACTDMYDCMGMMDQPSTAWTHATLHLAVINWDFIIHADSWVKKITEYVDLIAPILYDWMTAQRNHNMATQMKVYAHLDDDVLPNITNKDLAVLLQDAVQLWNDEIYTEAVRPWLQSHDILRLVRGPLTPLG